MHLLDTIKALLEGDDDMATIIDFASEEVPIGTQSLPLNLVSENEILLTSIFLNMSSANVKVVVRATVGWQAQLDILIPLLPEVTFRIRRGGFTPAFPEVYKITDSTFLGAGNLIPVITAELTTTLNHVESPDPATIGTFQQYFLTAQLEGMGAATILGPVTLIGQVIG